MALAPASIACPALSQFCPPSIDDRTATARVAKSPPDPAALEARLSAMVGIVENGLFIGLASKIVVGRPTGVEVFER
jgi:Ribose 5-phosphate isomerase A (phosphoriboisomerase A)